MEKQSLSQGTVNPATEDPRELRNYAPRPYALDTDQPTHNVYQCIAVVSAEIAKAGIAKDRQNQQQGYSFRGIDDVYNALAPILSKAGLVILPRILSRAVTEREARSGGVLFYVVVEAEFDFVSAHDGSKHTVRTYGEAMDSADKATNKAMSAAYKYAAFQAFCIPTEGDHDADGTTPEVKAPRPRPVARPEPQPKASQAPPTAPVTTEPEGYAAWIAVLGGLADEGEAVLNDALSRSQEFFKVLRETEPNRLASLRTRARSKGRAK